MGAKRWKIWDRSSPQSTAQVRVYALVVTLLWMA